MAKSGGAVLTNSLISDMRNSLMSDMRNSLILKVKILDKFADINGGRFAHIKWESRTGRAVVST